MPGEEQERRDADQAQHQRELAVHAVHEVDEGCALAAHPPDPRVAGERVLHAANLVLAGGHACSTRGRTLTTTAPGTASGPAAVGTAAA